MSALADSSATRTALAWQRTSLSILAGALLLVRLSEGWLRLLGLVTVLVVGPATAWVVWGARPDAPHSRPRPGRTAAVAATATVVGLAALLMTVTGSFH